MSKGVVEVVVEREVVGVTANAVHDDTEPRRRGERPELVVIAALAEEAAKKSPVDRHRRVDDGGGVVAVVVRRVVQETDTDVGVVGDPAKNSYGAGRRSWCAA